MIAFISVARTVVVAYKAVRAAVGIMLVAHGTYKWVQNKKHVNKR